MTERIPTELGDVLILRTDKTFTTHAVGAITRKGQQDFQSQIALKYVSGRAAAVAEAKALVVPGRRIFFRNIDTDDWAEISN